MNNYNVFIIEDSLNLMELPLTLSYLSFLLISIPTAPILSKRLCPKLIQDPFLDQDGREHNYLQEIIQ